MNIRELVGSEVVVILNNTIGVKGTLEEVFDGEYAVHGLMFSMGDPRTYVAVRGGVVYVSISERPHALEGRSIELRYESGRVERGVLRHTAPYTYSVNNVHFHEGVVTDVYPHSMSMFTA